MWQCTFWLGLTRFWVTCGYILWNLFFSVMSLCSFISVVQLKKNIVWPFRITFQHMNINWNMLMPQAHFISLWVFFLCFITVYLYHYCIILISYLALLCLWLEFSLTISSKFQGSSCLSDLTNFNHSKVRVNSSYYQPGKTYEAIIV